MGKVLDVRNLTGGYHASKPVLHDVSFEVHPGEIVGLIGLNGAGKSTTIKHILGLMEPIKGSVTIDGHSFIEQPNEYRASLAYIPEIPILYEELTLWEHLELTAMAYDVDEKTLQVRGEALLKEFKMDKMKRWFPSHFSKGMKQKVMIMCAFLVNPSVYIVDEPIVGLDPVGIKSFLDLTVEMKENGASVLMSTHILATAEKYCDRFIILHRGRVILYGTLQDLQAKLNMPNGSLDDIYIEATKDDSQ
ncbi:ABC transporter ATP-binding protein [Alkalihalobacterium chitinilyticum]|uniref:ABC transporter ATP-binding protein n=1 Tax=Alkalihalobacterium chitinilyticum TaxID=2980103 RepID=A0ABT5VHQ2_9BACI|nr:ABC transporter ATP-binding protein [Alkalihalobacterium chitinilyticum]MDE5414981.1 ABC transporter ATP-binding protein [Alkalihalobacterium chitinilyticum]